MTEVRLHDGSALEVEVHGHGPALLLPVNPRPIEGSQAEQLRQYGADPALGKSLIDGLDHMQAMQANQVLPVLRPWLEEKLKD